MKTKIIMAAMLAVLTITAEAQSWASSWEWPLVPIRQQFNPDDQKAADMEAGATGPYWLYPPYSWYNGVVSALRVETTEAPKQTEPATK